MYIETNEACKRIKAALRRRSGKAWSVTHGRGTDYGWITIRAMGPGSMTDDQCRELAELLGLARPCHPQGESVPSGSYYREEYVDRAEGRTPARCGAPYWD